MSCLCLEGPATVHPIIEGTLTQLNEKFLKESFQLEPMEPLDAVNVKDLLEFMRSDHCTCPKEKDFLPDMPKWIHQKTGGEFEPTVELIERAEKTSWYTLYDELSKR
jgi:hypothetical protein